MIQFIVKVPKSAHSSVKVIVVPLLKDLTMLFLKKYHIFFLYDREYDIFYVYENILGGVLMNHDLFNYLRSQK